MHVPTYLRTYLPNLYVTENGYSWYSSKPKSLSPCACIIYVCMAFSGDLEMVSQIV